jgi:hypothetical protein
MVRGGGGGGGTCAFGIESHKTKILFLRPDSLPVSGAPPHVVPLIFLFSLFLSRYFAIFIYFFPFFFFFFFSPAFR